MRTAVSAEFSFTVLSATGELYELVKPHSRDRNISIGLSWQIARKVVTAYAFFVPCRS